MTQAVVFLGFGDVVNSAGAGAYLASILKTLRREGVLLSADYFQRRVSGGGASRDCEEVMEMRSFPSPDFFSLTPSAAWSLLEMAWANREARRLIRSRRIRGSVCLVTGFGLLPSTRILRREFSRLVYVQHGIAEEFLLSRRVIDFFKYGMAKVLERRYLRYFDMVIVVSEPMAAYCQREYGGIRTAVIPCCVDDAVFRYDPQVRERMRRDLGVTGRIVVVYCGGAASWQCPRETVDFFRSVRSRIPEAFLLVISRDKSTFGRLTRDLSRDDCAVIGVEHGDVPRYLMAGDIGLLLRRNLLVNRVAAPVKFAEYLACGLPVVVSPFVGDYSLLVREHGIGVLVDPDDYGGWPASLSEISRLVGDEEVRRRCMVVAGELSWRRVSSGLLRALGIRP